MRERERERDVKVQLMREGKKVESWVGELRVERAREQ